MRNSFIFTQITFVSLSGASAAPPQSEDAGETCSGEGDAVGTQRVSVSEVESTSTSSKPSSPAHRFVLHSHFFAVFFRSIANPQHALIVIILSNVGRGCGGLRLY